MELHLFAVGDRVEKLCKVCNEERGHFVSSITKKGTISRVTCPQCNTRSTFKLGTETAQGRGTSQESLPYDWARTYRKGQTMMHATFGLGEVTAVIDPQKIDVLFPDRVRRLAQARGQA
jgi:hypothetical protein